MCRTPQYITEDAPEKVVKRTMNQNRAIRQNEQPAPRKKGKGKPGKKRRTVFLPALFGITIAFALACMALCWMILNDSSNLMNNKADVTLGDYIGMTKDQAIHLRHRYDVYVHHPGVRRYPAAPSARVRA